MSRSRTVSLLVTCLVFLGLSPLVVAAGREPPVPVRTVAPDYPRELRNQGISGVVMVKVTIDEQGNVTATAVSKSSNEGFNNFAMDAVKKWKFKPAQQDGNPVGITVTIPIKFVADES